MSNTEFAVRLFIYCSAALTAIVCLLWFWPSDEKLNKIRPEDYPTDDDFLRAMDMRNENDNLSRVRLIVNEQLGNAVGNGYDPSETDDDEIATDLIDINSDLSSKDEQAVLTAVQEWKEARHDGKGNAHGQT